MQISVRGGAQRSWRRRGQGRARRARAHQSARDLARRFEGTTDRVPREYSEYPVTTQGHLQQTPCATRPNGTRTRTRTRAVKWEWAFAKRRKWERVPQQYAEGPPALAGGGPGCSRFARACLAANGCMRPPGPTMSNVKPTSEPAVHCHRAAYDSSDRRGVAMASPHSYGVAAFLSGSRLGATHRPSGGGGDSSDDRRRWRLDCGE